MRPLVMALCAAMLLPSTVTAQTLERIKESGQIVIGFRTDAAPLSYLEDNRPQGYTPAICFELAAKIGGYLELTDLEVIFESVDTEDRFDRVASGDIDLLCGAATITLSRREIVDFSIPVYVDGTTVALKADGPQSLPELAGRKIGVRAGTTTLEALTNSLNAQGIDAEVVQFADHPSGMAALQGGAVDAYFADQSILMNMAMQSDTPENLRVLEEILTVEKHGLALAKGDDAFRLTVDRGLSELFQSGQIREIFAATVPGATPGFALEAMFLLSPTLP
ncbi:MAG: amino acid ABC transporter substrate-binding protein [Roseobacter sp.]|nr:amino acid ABC transporter substrate-binding protein [Roseobacter sp.]